MAGKSRKYEVTRDEDDEDTYEMPTVTSPSPQEMYIDIQDDSVYVSKDDEQAIYENTLTPPATTPPHDWEQQPPTPQTPDQYVYGDGSNPIYSNVEPGAAKANQGPEQELYTNAGEENKIGSGLRQHSPIKPMPLPKGLSIKERLRVFESANGDHPVSPSSKSVPPNPQGEKHSNQIDPPSNHTVPHSNNTIPEQPVENSDVKKKRGRNDMLERQLSTPNAYIEGGHTQPVDPTEVYSTPHIPLPFDPESKSLLGKKSSTKQRCNTYTLGVSLAISCMLLVIAVAATIVLAVLFVKANAEAKAEQPTVSDSIPEQNSDYNYNYLAMFKTENGFAKLYGSTRNHTLATEQCHKWELNATLIDSSRYSTYIATINRLTGWCTKETNTSTTYWVHSDPKLPTVCQSSSAADGIKQLPCEDNLCFVCFLEQIQT